MSPQFKSFVAQLFSRYFKKALPGFDKAQQDCPEAFILLVMHRVSEELYVFVAVVGAFDRDQFAIEVAWNDNAVYPAKTRKRNPIDVRGQFRAEAFRQRSFRTRAERLWGERRDYWWRLHPSPSLDDMISGVERLRAALEGPITKEEGRAVLDRAASSLQPAEMQAEDLSRVEVQVSEACDKIRSYVIPYIAAVVSAKT